ncbi:tripartite tricarboxylate transporter substrate binding protein [Ammoniphilus sp. YIM 78166]|uniref:tripartite tricarboxylate transporter substrate binding protein n=1 Tax=Ammoniphilus sp. YIM 78166 TaxID=1644106 RepID=UPI00106F62A7|nr:tripartite tricarboxylate transporter substrate binding protein [Ammoniphilus sp. YIM 78166]
MKRLKSALVGLLFLTALVGCSTQDSVSSSTNPTEPSNAKEINYPTKPIKLIVSYAAGGGTDTGARMLTSYLEKELGVPVVVENKPGGSGWIGWGELSKAKTDGYTIGYVNAPAIFAGYIKPDSNRKENLDSFEFIINHVVDVGVIAVRSDDNRFSTINDLIEYAKTNELTTSASGVGTENHLAALQLNKKMGTKLTSVQFGGTAEALTGVMGGHVDVLMAKVGEVMQAEKEGKLKILAVAKGERVAQFPDVPTIKEAVGADVEFYSLRGIAGPKGLDPQIVEKLQTAFENAMKNPEHVQKMSDLGLAIDGTKGEEYLQVLKHEEAIMLDFKDELGW